jgi:hypothetical protein
MTTTKKFVSSSSPTHSLEKDGPKLIQRARVNQTKNQKNQNDESCVVCLNIQETEKEFLLTNPEVVIRYGFLERSEKIKLF